MSREFPKGFLWGTATASAQVEGGWNEDGRTPSIWDMAPKGKVHNDEKPYVASDQYHRYKEDVQLMKSLGYQTYRFSLSWSRIMPAEGKVNQKGLDYYNDLINELLANGIEPMVTIFHWDLPMWVYEKGGWESEEIIDLFGQYVKVVAEAFSDRVRYWYVYNEIQCFILNSYIMGVHAPFKKKYLSIMKLSRIAMKAHGVGVRTLRQYAKKPVKIGIAMANSCHIPKDDSPAAIEKARQKTFKGYNGMSTSWFGDPMLLGKGIRQFGILHISQKDAEEIYQPLDFLGINNYFPAIDKDYDSSGKEFTEMGWVVDERSIYWVSRFMYERYHLPIIISENGCAMPDKLEDGAVHDERRIDYYRRYIKAVKKAIDDGVDIFGYTAWSFIDNFEWAEGYRPRFGLVYCDYENNCQRIIKDSARYYSKIIASNGREL